MSGFPLPLLEALARRDGQLTIQHGESGHWRAELGIPSANGNLFAYGDTLEGALWSLVQVCMRRQQVPRT